MHILVMFAGLLAGGLGAFPPQLFNLLAQDNLLAGGRGAFPPQLRRIRGRGSRDVS